MANYQVLARKYRPKTFKEVVAQEVVVTTLKNALKYKRLAHAYLFCGPRGTGKTTLARLFAKMINCANRGEDLEPCNCCSSCEEIAGGHSLDVLEIDGASNRGIDDIRQINETVGYSAAGGREKIYIIDEVHMLTKEAFNALLKTLEEPPAKVKFLFATTEPHKVPATILSRCQRFNLTRIPPEKIVSKLQEIALDAGIEIEEQALRLIADRADGGLRDAESLLDQVHAFHDGMIAYGDVAALLGVMPRDALFAFDIAAKEGRYAAAFEVAEELFAQGKDYLHFVEMLVDHFRNILLVKVGGKGQITDSAEAERYAAASSLYSREQCMTLLDLLVEAQGKLRLLPSPRIAIEALLLQVVRSHKKIPVELLVRKLVALEQSLVCGSLTVDPTPRAEELPPPKVKVEAPPPPPKPQVQPPAPKPVALPVAPPQKNSVAGSKSPSHYDTLIQFAAVELGGSAQKLQTKIINTKGQ